MRHVILLPLAIVACGSACGSNGHTINMGEPPESWHCTSFQKAGEPQRFGPCATTEETCIKGRATAMANGFDATPCTKFERAFCYLSNETPNGVRACHATMPLCREARQRSIARGNEVTGCQPLPP